MSQYNAIYHYEVKDFYNNQLVRCKVRCLVIGETVKSYRIRLLEPCRNRMALEELWVGKKSIFRSMLNNESGICDIYELSPADVSCRACLQKCYRRLEMEAKYKKNET